MPRSCHQPRNSTPRDKIKLTRTALIEEVGSRTFIFGRWDCQFGAWITSGDRKQGTEWLPSFPLFNANGRSAIGADTVDHLPDDDAEPIVGEAYPLDRHVRCNGPEYVTATYLVEGKRDEDVALAFAGYCELIPKPIRKLVGPFGKWQWPLLKGIGEVEGLFDFLETELKCFGTGYVAACLILGDDQLADRQSRCKLLERVMRDRRTELLRSLTWRRWSKAGVRALSRFDATSAEGFDFDILMSCMDDPCRAKIISQAGSITPTMIRQFKRLPDCLCQPSMFDALRDDGIEPKVSALLGYGIKPPPIGLQRRMSQSLRQIRNLDLDDWLETWGPEVLAHLPFPVPPFEGTELLQPIKSVEEMRREARLMQNCLDQVTSLNAVMFGQRYFYRWLGIERATVSFSRRPDRQGIYTWRRGIMAGVANGELSSITKRQIHKTAQQITAS